MNFDAKYAAKYKGKKITLMGLGLLGRGVGDAAFFAEAGAELTVTDLKTKKELASSLAALRRYKNIRFVLGEHRLEDFRNADLVVKAAGVPLGSPFIAEAEKAGVPVMMSTGIFAKETPAKIVGVTGTRGKSTVAYLLHEILKANLKVTKKSTNNSAGKVFLGGNVLGVSTLSLLPKTRAGDTVVLELDSWQLQGFKDFSPPVAVFTTFMPDHMNYYQGDMPVYFADKANIYRSQKAGDILVVSEQVLEFINKFGPPANPKTKVVVAKAADLPGSWKMKILGEHNRLNAALAVAAAHALGISDEVIRKAVENFKPVPGRLALIRKHKGVEIYNDTNSTTPDATIVALKAFGRDHKTVLIFGGAEKNLDPTKMLEILPDYTKALVVLPGAGTEKVRPELVELAESISKIPKMPKIPVVFVKTMNEAVKKARALAVKGDRILMSPGFASFGLFKNEYDRGDQFGLAVKKLK